eukprot:UN25176
MLFRKFCRILCGCSDFDFDEDVSEDSNLNNDVLPMTLDGSKEDEAKTPHQAYHTFGSQSASQSRSREFHLSCQACCARNVEKKFTFFGSTISATTFFFILWCSFAIYILSYFAVCSLIFIFLHYDAYNQYLEPWTVIFLTWSAFSGLMYFSFIFILNYGFATFFGKVLAHNSSSDPLPLFRSLSYKVKSDDIHVRKARNVFHQPL